jgi:CDP-6-deoxy-D-xylo-4-hexulose-3-dehydrase
MISHPLMHNNFELSDFKEVIKLLKKKNPILTQSQNVNKFEKSWSKWLGAKYSIFVNSGSSANLITISALKYLNNNKARNEIIVPSLTWSSDVVSIIKSGYKPVFVDINLKNLGANEKHIFSKINKKTLAIFITHAQGFNALTEEILKVCDNKKIYLIEDVCESHGAEYKGKKVGTFGLASNFSFYYAHHMSTIEGGMVCTDNKKLYEIVRAMRSPGMHREMEDKNLRTKIEKKYKNLSPKFIFLYPGYNFRNNEIGALIGLSQLKRLNKAIKLRKDNLNIFLSHLDQTKYFTDYTLEGNSNYAFPIILKKYSIKKRNDFERILYQKKIEFRRGNAGGGNLTLQPFVKNYVKNLKQKDFKNVNIIHKYGYYIGNYPHLTKQKILRICKILNGIDFCN